MDPEFAKLFTSMIASDVKQQAAFTNSHLQLADRATLLALQRGALPGQIAGLSTASHVPESNPYAVAK